MTSSSGHFIYCVTSDIFWKTGASQISKGLTFSHLSSSKLGTNVLIADYYLNQLVNNRSMTPTQVEGDFAGKTRTSTSRGNPVTQESSECSEAQEAAHVSETDLDVSEMETLPYTASPTHREPSGQMSGQVAADEEEEDALQLVREIFFSR